MERTIDISEAIRPEQDRSISDRHLYSVCPLPDHGRIRCPGPRLSCSRDLGAGPPSDRRKESRDRDHDTAAGHGAISERPEHKRLHNGMNCRRPGQERCELQLISGWLETTSLRVKV